MYYAVSNPHPGAREQILEDLLQRECDVNCVDHNGHTPLWHAAQKGNTRAAELMLQRGADANRLNEWKSSPTIIAMLKGHYGIVDYLLGRKEIDASLVDDQGRTLVAQLCLNLNEESFKNLKFLISKRKIDVTRKTV